MMSTEDENVVKKGFLLFHVPLVVPPQKKKFVKEIRIDTTRMAGIRLTQVQKKCGHLSDMKKWEIVPKGCHGGRDGEG